MIIPTFVTPDFNISKIDNYIYTIPPYNILNRQPKNYMNTEFGILIEQVLQNKK